MENEGHIAHPPSARRLLAMLLGAFVAGSIIVFAAILPAEFGLDPLGIGRVTGLNGLAPAQTVAVNAAAPAGTETTARFYDTEFRTDTIDISLPADGTDGSELEYKVRMKPGESLVYSWTVTVDKAHPDWFYYDFHGETWPRPPNAPPKIAEYKQATGLSSNGSFVAPFEGVHGWYFQNQSDKPAVVHLKLSGFYRLVPPGEYGNESKILPLAPDKS